MDTLRKKQKLGWLLKEICEELPVSNLAQKTNVPRSQECFMTRISEKIEGRLTKKLSKEFYRMEGPFRRAIPT